jgi:hypothetical protein
MCCPGIFECDISRVRGLRMTYSDRTAVHRVADAAPSWQRELVQARADDVVLAASLFKPNAAGSYELTVGAGFGQRQLLKAKGAYLGERIVLGVTPLHVCAVSVLFGGRASRLVGRWPRTELRAEPVCPLGTPPEVLWPALLLTDRHRGCLAELQTLDHDDDAWRLLTLLLRR